MTNDVFLLCWVFFPSAARKNMCQHIILLDLFSFLKLNFSFNSKLKLKLNRCLRKGLKLVSFEVPVDFPGIPESLVGILWLHGK